MLTDNRTTAFIATLVDDNVTTSSTEPHQLLYRVGYVQCKADKAAIKETGSSTGNAEQAILNSSTICLHVIARACTFQETIVIKDQCAKTLLSYIPTKLPEPRLCLLRIFLLESQHEVRALTGL